MNTEQDELISGALWEEAITQVLLDHFSDSFTSGITLSEWEAQYIAAVVASRVQDVAAKRKGQTLRDTDQSSG